MNVFQLFFFYVNEQDLYIYHTLPLILMYNYVFYPFLLGIFVLFVVYLKKNCTK